MSTFDRTKIRLVSDPRNFPLGAKDFEFPRAPEARFQPDEPGYVQVKLGDGSYMQDLIGEDLRAVDIICGPGAFLLGDDLEKWRLFRRAGHFIAVYPNYDLTTYLLNHFESNLTSEVLGVGAVNPTMGGVGGAATYVPGILGQALDLNADQRLSYNGTLPTTGSMNAWFQFPADGSWRSMRGLYIGGLNHWMGYLQGSEFFRFRVSQGNDIDLSPGQLPPFSAGEWFNLGWSWRSGSSRQGKLVFNGSETYTYTLTLGADPTMQAPWYLGYAFVGGSEYYNGVIDEFRFTAEYYGTDNHGALYDRMAYPTAKTLAGQTQGQYFRIVADGLQFASTADEKIVGALRLGPAYADNRFIVKTVSATWPRIGAI